MKRVFVTAIVCGVWLSGVTSAAALTYVLDRPLTPSPASMAAYQPRHAAELTDRSTAADEDPSVVVRADRPAAQRAPTPRVHAVQPEAPRDIQEMLCAPPRDLEMGSGRVTVCE
jgi:hypothetical protein